MMRGYAVGWGWMYLEFVHEDVVHTHSVFKPHQHSKS